MKYITVSPSQLCCHGSRLRHDKCHEWTKILLFWRINSENVYTNQHGRLRCLKGLWMNESGKEPPAVLADVMLVSEWSVQHKLGYGSHRLASPALSNHSDMARPQACCPNSTLAPGKVEAEGTLAKSTSTIISPRLSTVTLRHPLHLSSLLPLASFISLGLVLYSSKIGHFCCTVKLQWMKYEEHLIKGA